MPHYAIQSIGVVVADDGVIRVTEAIQFIIKFHGHVFEFIAYLADMSDAFDFVIGQKMLYEDYLLMDDILFKIRYVKEQKGKPTLVLCVPEKYILNILYQYHTPLLAGHSCVMMMYHMV